MGAAVDELGLSELHREELWSYLERAAYAMLNTFED
jgi:hemoglobin